jgi:hypothetical protein
MAVDHRGHDVAAADVAASLEAGLGRSGYAIGAFGDLGIGLLRGGPPLVSSLGGPSQEPAQSALVLHD